MPAPSPPLPSPPLPSLPLESKIDKCIINNFNNLRAKGTKQNKVFQKSLLLLKDVYFKTSICSHNLYIDYGCPEAYKKHPFNPPSFGLPVNVVYSPVVDNVSISKFSEHLPITQIALIFIVCLRGPVNWRSLVKYISCSRGCSLVLTCQTTSGFVSISFLFEDFPDP